MDDLSTPVEPLIFTVRGQKVILDMDLARIYGVTVKRLNEQVKRNRKKFRGDFMFRVNQKESVEMLHLRSQNATSKKTRGGRRYLPYVFTEQGAIMAASVLNSPAAIRTSVFVVRAFMRMREIFLGQKGLARQLAALEKELAGRLDVHEVAIVDILQRMMELLDPPPEPPMPPAPPKPPIGFHV